MLRKVLLTGLVAVAVVALGGSGRAEEWSKATVICPVCGALNAFYTPGDVPKDAYDRPERFQYLFWPMTDKRVLFCCKKCRYTVFAGDWPAMPSDREDAIHGQLGTVKTNTNVSDYTTIPMSARFEIAEKIYTAWGKDDAFMCDFHRARAYHLEAENMTEAAAEARKKALDLAAKLLQKPPAPGRKKELLIISAAMKDMTGDGKGALADVKSALEIKYEDAKDELAPGVRRDEYLTKLGSELSGKLESAPGATT